MWGYKEYPSEKIHFRPVWGNIFSKVIQVFIIVSLKVAERVLSGLDLTSKKAMATHSSTLAWKSHERRSLVGYSPWGLEELATRLSDFTFTFHFNALEKEMATHSSVLAWRIPGTGEPGGLPSLRSHRVGHDWSDLAAAADLTLLQANSLLFLWCYQ